MELPRGRRSAESVAEAGELGKRRLQGYSCAAIAGEYLAKYLPKLVFFLFPPLILLHLPAF